MGSYRRLKVWRAAHELTCAVYAVTRALPPADRFGLGDQLRRASVSIGANVAEGCGRNGDRELGRYVDIALGSANELHYLIEVARDTGLLAPATTDPLMNQAAEICRMLSGLRAATRRPRSAAAPAPRSSK